VKHPISIIKGVFSRGEVGLIFAATGKSVGVLTDELFSVIVLVVVLTTFVAPPLIKWAATRVHPKKVVSDNESNKQPVHAPAPA